MFCNLGRMDLVYDDVRYMIYRWGFPYLDYSFDVLISWNRKLGCTAGFILFAFIGFYFRFLSLLLLLLLYYTCIHHGSPLVCYPHWSPTLILLYHVCSLLDITYYLSAYSCMLVLTTQFSVYALLIQIYRYTCACPCAPFGVHHTTRWGVSDSPGSVCPDPKVWNLWILPVAD